MSSGCSFAEGKGGLVKPETGMKVIQEQVWFSRSQEEQSKVKK